MNNTCIVFICTSNYFERFAYTYNQLISNGKYSGDVCLVVGDDLKNLKLDQNIIIKHFPEFTFSEEFKDFTKNLQRDSRWNQRFFQYNKFQLFNEYFKKWNYVFYLDCGITIYDDVNPMIQSCITQCGQEPKFLAHSDAYPTYQNKLKNQFVSTGNAKEIYEILERNFNLEVDYPQTTIMFYNTNIITSETVDDLYNLLLKYPNSTTNDQGTIALYFTSIKKYFEQIVLKGTTSNGNETFFYDYHRRDKTKNYVMVKCLY